MHTTVQVLGVAPRLRGGGEKHEIKSLFFIILNAPFLTFPRCAGEGGNRRRRCTPLMLEQSQFYDLCA
jgi:hypothetical protein